MNIHYQTDRLLVRDLEPADAQGIFELDTDPKVMTFLGGVSMKSIEKAEKVVEDIIWQYKEFGTGRLAIEDKTTGEFIGWTGIKRERGLRDFPYYDLGYRLKFNYWGQGIATETARFSLNHGFNTLGLNLINAAADIAHKASQNVLLKSGLKTDGTFYYENIEHYWYRITREDWENLKFID